MKIKRGILIVIGLIAVFVIASQGSAGEKYRMWFQLKQTASTKVVWKPMPGKFRSLQSCQNCLLGNREMAIDVALKDADRDKDIVLDRIERYGNDGFRVYWRVPWGWEREDWKFYCFPATVDPSK